MNHTKWPYLDTLLYHIFLNETTKPYFTTRPSQLMLYTAPPFIPPKRSANHHPPIQRAAGYSRTLDDDGRINNSRMNRHHNTQHNSESDVHPASHRAPASADDILLHWRQRLHPSRRAIFPISFRWEALAVTSLSRARSVCSTGAPLWKYLQQVVNNSSQLDGGKTCGAGLIKCASVAFITLIFPRVSSRREEEECFKWMSRWGGERKKCKCERSDGVCGTVLL